MSVSKRFELKVGAWYACEIIGDEFDEDCCSYSPIKVTSISGLSATSKKFVFGFYHANYPEGVRYKEYQLTVLKWGERFLLASSRRQSAARVLQIYDIDAAWLLRHFGVKKIDVPDITAWLDENA